MMTRKTFADIDGWEHDWLAIDEGGAVALFSTAGFGFVPGQYLDDTDAYQEAIAFLIGQEPCTIAIRFPPIPEGIENTWRMMAERGLYAYDFDDDVDSYVKVAVPATPIGVDALPAAIAKLASRTRCKCSFETTSRASSAILDDAKGAK